MLVCDTSGLIAYFDSSDRFHQAVSTVFEREAGPFIVSPYVLAELDYLIATRRGVAQEIAALAELAGGAWELAAFDGPAVERAVQIVTDHRDQDIGLTDASLVVLADRYRTNRILTLDRRHFDVLRTARGRPFALLPRP